MLNYFHASANHASQHVGFIMATNVALNLNVQNNFPQQIFDESRRHRNGSVHASSLFNRDNDQVLEHWFTQNLVQTQDWVCWHPHDFPMDVSRNFVDYIHELEASGLRVWDVKNDIRATGYLNLTSPDGRLVVLTGRGDYLLTSNEATEADYLWRINCIVEIQSQQDEHIRRCELQLQLYLLILMNTRGLANLLGFLVQDNGMCRAYRARRDGRNCIYEENDEFHVCHIAAVVEHLMDHPEL